MEYADVYPAYVKKPSKLDLVPFWIKSNNKKKEFRISLTVVLSLLVILIILSVLKWKVSV